MTRAFSLIALATSLLVLLSVPRAEAAPIRECGNAGTLHDGQVRVYNVTSRNVVCPRARRFARNQMRYGGPACAEDRYCTYRGWRCTHFPGDIRCTNSARVIHWHYR
jgi:hypothetical protein